MWFDLLTFAVPFNAGSLEGSRVLVFKLLGFTAALGMAYGIALRLAQIFWAMAGLAFYGELIARKRASPGPKPIAKTERERTVSRVQT